MIDTHFANLVLFYFFIIPFLFHIDKRLEVYKLQAFVFSNLYHPIKIQFHDFLN